MNFFEQQDIARRNTKRLVLLLCAAVVSLIAMTTLLFAALAFFMRGSNSASMSETPPSFWESLGTVISWEMIGLIALGVISVVLLGGLFKYLRLGRGGSSVAVALGGYLVEHDTQDFNERKLLNVVEEMAIAAGAPVPLVYVLNESGINAFAAGHTPQDAVIGVTRGCIEQLNRDELQGVIAHEFSHVFYGDMRLNMRLVAILHGILLLGLIGQILLRGSLFSGHRSRHRSSSSKDSNGGHAAILAAGVGLIVIGYAGTFFGNWIKAAVSRQREFLADASAVQYTRNDEGIAGALKKIGGYMGGTRIRAARSSEFSHMYFAEGVTTAFRSLMATHPPLGERIKRIQPAWDGEYIHTDEVTPAQPEQSEVDGPGPSRADIAMGMTAAAAATVSASELDHAVNHIGSPDEKDLQTARDTLAQIPDNLRQWARSGDAAPAIVLGLLLDNDRELRKKQWQGLTNHYPIETLNTWREPVKHACQVPALARLALLELSLPALKNLDEQSREGLGQAMDTLIEMDDHVNLMEWSLRRIVTHHLGKAELGHTNKNLRSLRNECQVLLSFLAHAGTSAPDEAQSCFERGCDTLRLASLTLMPLEELSVPALDRALESLNKTTPLQQPLLLKAMTHCIEHDGAITVAEAEMFRAVADSLNCPVPPLRPDSH